MEINFQRAMLEATSGVRIHLKNLVKHIENDNMTLALESVRYLQAALQEVHVLNYLQSLNNYLAQDSSKAQ